MSESAPTFPSEEYIAGRERGRVAGLKVTLKIRIRRIVVSCLAGGAFAGIMFASPATTGRTSFAPFVALSIFSLFVVLGGLGCLKALHMFRRSMRHPRDDIVRSVMKPDDATPEPGRLRKWWLRGDSYGGNPWEAAATDGANDGRRKY